jgi:zinc protease
MESKFSVPRLLVGFPTIQAGDPDQAALAVLEGILGLGKRARLYRAMVEGAEVASAVGAEHSPGRYPGALLFSVELLPGKDRAAVEKLLLSELAQLRERPVQAAELRRVQQQLVADAVFRQEGTYGLANRIGQAVAVTSLDAAREYLPRILAVTPADVQRVAKKYLDPQRTVTVWSLPASKKTGMGATPGRAVSRVQAREAGSAAAVPFDLNKAQRVELPNGLVVLLFETRRLPIVEVQALLRESSIFQTDAQLGVAGLTGRLLDEGTTRRTGAEIAEAIENVGGELSLGASGGSVRVLAPDRRLGLGLLLECLQQPAFAKDAFARARAQLLAEISEAETRPEARASQRFRKLVYGTHPLGRRLSGTRETVSALTPEDCRAFHGRVFVPNNLILAVAGDFDSKAVLAEIRDLTAGWKKGTLPDYAKLDVPLPEKFTQEIITMPRAAQLQVFLGHVGIRRNNPDFYKLLVMDHVLGTGSGFTDRLSARLRDREGLAYSVSATISSSAGLEPGMFTAYIGTDTDKFDRVKELFLEELNRIRDEKASAQEVEDAKTYLIGSRQLQFATTGGIARQLVGIEQYGLGFDYLEKFEKAVGAVTPADVQEVARKHLHPSRMVLVGAGAVDSKGQPLKK